MIRFTLPHADPYLFPLVAVLACFGLVVIYRIDEDLARDQAQWFVIGLIAFAATIVLLRDFRVLERYRYTIALAGLALLLLPRVPGIGQQVNGAYLGVGIGPVSFQPAELGKIAIVIFLAAYLRDTRQVLVQGSRRFLGVTIPPLQALRAAARGLGRGDVHARLHPRPRLVADVLRRVPGADLRRHQPAQLRRRRAGDVRRRRVVLRHHGRPRAGPHRRLAGPVRARALRRRRRLVPDRQRPVRDGGRRAVRARAGRRDPQRARRRAADPGAGDRHDLRGHRQRPRAGRRRRRARSPTC